MLFDMLFVIWTQTALQKARTRFGERPAGFDSSILTERIIRLEHNDWGREATVRSSKNESHYVRFK